MGKRSDARAQRKAAQQARFEASKPSLIAKVGIDRTPKNVIDPAVENTPRLAPHLERAAANTPRSPKATQDGSRFGSRVTWCISKADRIDQWSWGESRDWLEDEWVSVIEPAFVSFEKLTWGDIDKFSSETGHKMHHGHEIGDLITEAQRRWLSLELEQYETIFRFRLGGTRRAWGFLVQSHFHFVWWDREHSLYPT
jgi:hypothetical protein